MKTLVLIGTAMFPLFVAAGNGTVYNCPKHGPRSEYEVQRTGQTITCKACLKEKEQNQKDEDAKAKSDRISRGVIFESDMFRMDKITINTRSFGSTNNFERMCFPAITERYFKVNGDVRLRSDYQSRFKIIQHIGDGDYLAKWGDVWYKLCTTDTGLADESVYTLYGILTDELYSYQTVLGASKRVRVFRTLSQLGNKVEELTFADVLRHLNSGNTFTISMVYESKQQPTSITGNYRDLQIMAQNGRLHNDGKRRIEATITMKEGMVVQFGK